MSPFIIGYFGALSVDQLWKEGLVHGGYATKLLLIVTTLHGKFCQAISVGPYFIVNYSNSRGGLTVRLFLGRGFIVP